MKFKEYISDAKQLPKLGNFNAYGMATMYKAGKKVGLCPDTPNNIAYVLFSGKADYVMADDPFGPVRRKSIEKDDPDMKGREFVLKDKKLAKEFDSLIRWA